MKTLKITGVPEHFNYPWIKVIENQPFLDQGIQLEWIEESRGSGQMNKALRENETAIAIVLTESFLKDFEVGNPSKMIGFHVSTPLTWGIHLHGDSEVADLTEMANPKFLISRLGSGSHLMSVVLAAREHWDAEKLQFEVVDNLPGALKVMTPSIPALFLWEKYTTKPWVDRGELKRIGEVPSPWPCFVMVATDHALNEFGNTIFDLRDLVYAYSKKIKSTPQISMTLATQYQLEMDDVDSWLNQTEWATSAEVALPELADYITKMKGLGILESIISPNDFLRVDRTD